MPLDAANPPPSDALGTWQNGQAVAVCWRWRSRCWESYDGASPGAQHPDDRAGRCSGTDGTVRVTYTCGELREESPYYGTGLGYLVCQGSPGASAVNCLSRLTSR
jgi:hypothetical protein